MPLSEHVYCVAVTFKMTEPVRQQICIKFCFKLERSSMETIWMIQKATAMGNRWSEASSWQDVCSCIVSCAELLVKYQITQVTQAPCSPDLVPCDFWLFPKLKSPFKRKSFRPSVRFRKIWWAAHGDWENHVRSQGSYSEGDWRVIVLWTMFLVSCIFNKCLHFSYYMAGCFQTDLVLKSSMSIFTSQGWNLIILFFMVLAYLFCLFFACWDVVALGGLLGLTFV